LRVSALFIVLCIFGCEPTQKPTLVINQKVSVPIAIGINPQRLIAEIRWQKAKKNRIETISMEIENYIKERVDDQIVWYDGKSKTNKLYYQLFKVIEISFASILVFFALNFQKSLF